jgi:hypothetical protein
VVVATRELFPISSAEFSRGNVSVGNVVIKAAPEVSERLIAGRRAGKSPVAPFEEGARGIAPVCFADLIWVMIDKAE